MSSVLCRSSCFKSIFTNKIKLKNMQKLFFLLVLILPALAIAQNTEGEIVYTETIKLEINLPEGHEDMAASLPKEQKAQKLLYFTATESLYQNAPEDDEGDDVIEAGEGDVQIKMVIMRPSENKLYKDLAKAEKIQKEEFFGKLFLISGDLKKYAWKLTGQQKKVLDYNCQQAVYSDDEKKVAVWFTPEIPVSSGPGEYGQLPGMILEVSIDDGDRHIVANKVTFKYLEKDAIVVPKKGKKVTAEEFEEIRDAKMKEMEEEMGGGGMRIRIRN